MVIVNIHSGLGNQLFQYAFGRKVALDRNMELQFDYTLLYRQEKQHNFLLRNRLDNFNIVGKEASIDEIDKFKRIEYTSLFYRVLRKLSGRKIRLFKNNSCQIDESTFSKDKKKLATADNLYITGYLADIKLLAEFNDAILPDFKLITPLNELNINKKARIDAVNAVGIHIRRQDYKSQQEVFALLTMEYYKSAIEYITEKTNNPIFFVFSDDMDWVKKAFSKYFSQWNFEYVSINNMDTDFMELELMRSCKHFIIANSTFSWWAAWLNSNPNKIIIAPKKWYNKKQLQMDYENGLLVPSDWVKM